MRAADWFYGTSFHASAAKPTSPAAPAVHTDTRPRVAYVLPDGTTVKIIRDHGEYAQATCTYQIAGKIVQAIRADLWPQSDAGMVRS